MRKRVRITGRFYIILLVAVLILIWVVTRNTNGSAQVAIVSMASAQDTRTVDAIIVRDETVSSFTGVTRVVFSANEGTLVNAGDEIAYVFSAAYSESAMTNLENTRKKIQVYHKELLASIVDANLERLDAVIDERALEIKHLVTGENKGNLLSIEAQLESAMSARQEYLRQNKREDLTLNSLYAEETSRLNAISAWNVTATADKSGVVSFYLDGYESLLNMDTLSALTLSDIEKILSSTAESARSTTPVYRLVDQYNWTVIFKSRTNDWTPVVGQSYTFQVEGYESVIYSATVTAVENVGGEVAARMTVSDPIGPLLYLRTGKATLGTSLTGLLVPSSAVSVSAGQAGVYLNDIPGGTFIPVEILSSDGVNTLLRPLVSDALRVGHQVLIK